MGTISLSQASSSLGGGSRSQRDADSSYQNAQMECKGGSRFHLFRQLLALKNEMAGADYFTMSPFLAIDHQLVYAIFRQLPIRAGAARRTENIVVAWTDYFGGNVQLSSSAAIKTARITLSRYARSAKGYP